MGPVAMTVAAMKKVTERPRGEGHDSEVTVTCNPLTDQGGSDSEQRGSAPQSPFTPQT